MSSTHFLLQPVPSTYFSLAQLRDRGWTRRLIERYLGAPDLSARPSGFKFGRPSSLFEARRVQGIELDSTFSQVSEASKERQLLMSRVARSKTQGLIDLVDGAQIDVPAWDVQQLRHRAAKALGTSEG